MMKLLIITSSFMSLPSLMSLLFAEHLPGERE